MRVRRVGGEEDAISARRLVADNAYTAYTYTDDQRETTAAGPFGTGIRSVD